GLFGARRNQVWVIGSQPKRLGRSIVQTADGESKNRPAGQRDQSEVSREQRRGYDRLLMRSGAIFRQVSASSLRAFALHSEQIVMTELVQVRRSVNFSGLRTTSRSRLAQHSQKSAIRRNLSSHGRAGTVHAPIAARRQGA